MVPQTFCAQLHVDPQGLFLQSAVSSIARHDHNHSHRPPHPRPRIVGRIYPAPILANTSSSAESSSTASTCNDIRKCRALWGIVCGYIITIFACTHLSFHPNIPDRTHTSWRSAPPASALYCSGSSFRNSRRRVLRWSAGGSGREKPRFKVCSGMANHRAYL